MVKNCINCGAPFNANGNKVYCYEVKVGTCKYCGEAFKYICSKRPRLTCSAKCSKLKNNGARKSKKCLNCFANFLAIHNQLYCNKLVNKRCALCGSVFTIECNIKARNNNYNYCDSTCLQLSRGGIFSSRVSEYKNINSWAENFYSLNGRKPTVGDFTSYFNVRNLPKGADFSLFHITKNRGSFLEELFGELLGEYYGSEILRNRRPIRGSLGGRLELDFWLVDVNIAFEVNDFTSHSIANDFCMNKYSNYKHGPFYHGNKVSSAYEQLKVRLFHIWEDELLLGYGGNIIYGVLKDL